MPGLICDDKNLSPADFVRLILRTDGAGNYAIAVNDLTGPVFTQAVECGDGLSWEDVVAMVFDKTKNAINIVEV